MRSETPLQADSSEITVRPFGAEDQSFLTRVAPRIHPGQTVSPRDPAALDRYIADLQQGKFLAESAVEAFVAAIDGEPYGLVVVHPDKDYFTGHPRAYVEVLAVAREAEGRGVGRALMDHVDRWARDRAFHEVVLDVFAHNDGAIAFYERQGYRPDHIRMAKPLD